MSFSFRPPISGRSSTNFVGIEIGEHGRKIVMPAGGGGGPPGRCDC
ncbi:MULTISPECIES: hypothetical protein [Rhizobium]|uniref:Uncharacterized protein n=1 Tax=Rhizobium laguerreae TaxID=1076926 RepID=A0A6N9Z8I0_9HYPH|nr:hypothetical protein [Rhizobium laguerreae]